MTESPLSFSKITHASDLEFQPVKVKGHYLNSLILIVPNKFYQDKPGFEIYTPLKISNDKTLLLVDRGWIAKKSNSSIPIIKKVTANQSITGYLKLINEYQFILGNNVLNTNPIIIQKINFDEISKITHQDFYPFVLRLNPKEPNGFGRDWTLTTIVPARHMAYALQWFGLAIVVVIGYWARRRVD